MASDSRLQKPCNKLTTIAAVLLILVGVVFALTTVNVANGDNDLLDDLTRDAMFEGAATIVGLAIFGSAIGIRISRKPKIRDAKWRAGIFTYIAITALVVVQGCTMIYACCMDISNFTTSVLISLTTVLLIVIGGSLIIASSREDESKRVSESIRKELEAIRRLISTAKVRDEYNNYEVEYMHAYISHDIYDSLLATGLIRYIDYDVQQEIQNIIRTAKRHNEYLEQFEHMIEKDYQDATSSHERDMVFFYHAGMQSCEEKMVRDISALLGKL